MSEFDPLDNTSCIKQYAKNFIGSPAQEYILQRGISMETATRFHLGHNIAAPDFGEPNHLMDTIVFPTSSDSYVERKIDPNCTHATRYSNSVGKTHFFNEDVLKSATKPIFVTEGAMDALSIIECGGEAVALNSTAAVKKMLHHLEKEPPRQTIIIAMDTDDAGKKAADELAAGLTKLDIPHYVVLDWDGCKDANELLQRNRMTLEKLISKAEKEAKEATSQIGGKDKAILDKMMGNRMDNCVQQMLQAINENASRPRISTGIEMLDEALGGGIMPGLHLVAAMSSLGKTTLVVQMIANMAKQGQDVIFFSLEMSRLDLFAKNISRHTFELDMKNCRKLGQSTNDILNGAAYRTGDMPLKNHIQKAVEEYKKYADKLVVIEGFCDIGVNEVRQITEDFIRLTGRKPIVVIDYIQLLQPVNSRFTDKQNMDHAIKGLKQITAQGVAVIAISSLNRASYDSPVSLGSMKETGNLEYCAETVLAIDFQAMYTALRNGNIKEFDLNMEKQKMTRDVVLTILKNRNGPVGGQIAMSFYPEYNFFASKF